MVRYAELGWLPLVNRALFARAMIIKALARV